MKIGKVEEAEAKAREQGEYEADVGYKKEEGPGRGACGDDQNDKDLEGEGPAYEQENYQEKEEERGGEKQKMARVGRSNARARATIAQVSTKMIAKRSMTRISRHGNQVIETESLVSMRKENKINSLRTPVPSRPTPTSTHHSKKLSRIHFSIGREVP
jgi:hypothetical protein